MEKEDEKKPVPLVIDTTEEELKPKEMDKDQLLDAVRNQVEYYFSKENLQSDAYLTSQMDANLTVPINVVMKFAKMKALTEDESVLRKALETSSLTVINDRIKANIKAAGRSTIILREIPSDAAEDEVKEIFNFEGCKPITSMRSDIGDTWFVMMDNEEDAKDTLLDLKLKKRLFRGQGVKGRLKSETVVRSFYPVQPSPTMQPAIFPGMPMPFPSPAGFVPAGAMPVDMRFAGYAMGGMGGAPMMPGAMAVPSHMVDVSAGTAPAVSLASASADDAGESPRAGGAGKGDRRNNGGNGNGAYHPGHPLPNAAVATSTYRTNAPNAAGSSGSGTSGHSREGHVRDNRNSSAGKGAMVAPGSPSGRQNSSSGNKDKDGGGRSKKDGKVSAASSSSSNSKPLPRPTIEINSMNFPPLAGNAPSSGERGPDDGPEPAVSRRPSVLWLCGIVILCA